MDPSILLLAVAALACPLCMGAMMWMMNRQGGHQHMGMGSMPSMTREQHSFDSAAPRELRGAGDRLAILQAQKAALEKQIHELEGTQPLQERRDTLERDISAQQGETRV